MRINEQEITFTKKRGVKHLRIRIKEDGTCTVTVPFRVPLMIAKRFVEEKRVWIEEKQELMKSRREWREGVDVPSFAKSKDEALRFTTQRVRELNQYYGFSYAKVSVRNQKTRWGSCSSRGNLSFNYRILFLPAPLADYLIVHELCHVQEKNHGPAFWKLVEKTIPGYKKLRGDLKRKA